MVGTGRQEFKMKSADGEQSVGSGQRPAVPGSFELAAPFPSPPLVDDRQFPFAFVHLEMAGDSRRFRPFSLRQLDDDRPFSVAGLEFLGPSASRPVRSRRGLPVGSGIVESACKRIVGKRFKGAGRQRRARHQMLPRKQALARLP